MMTHLINKNIEDVVRNLSVKLAHQLDIPIILGTATPSLATILIFNKALPNIQSLFNSTLPIYLNDTRWQNMV